MLKPSLTTKFDSIYCIANYSIVVTITTNFACIALALTLLQTSLCDTLLNPPLDCHIFSAWPLILSPIQKWHTLIKKLQTE